MGLYQILTDPQNFKFYAEKSFPNVNANSKDGVFGQKSIGYGDSSQPYIQIAPPPVVGPTTGNAFSKAEDNIRYNSQSWGPDFLTRGNLFGAVRTADDVTRLTKYFFDKRSVSGYLFLAKQNLLSRVSPTTEASTGLAYGLGNLNAGIYTPASTIGQAAVSLIEGHLLKQGIDPTGTVQSLSIKTYQQALSNPLTGGISPNKNRLIKLSKLSYYTESEVESLNSLIVSPYKVKKNTDFFMSYGGGPDSDLGIGSTRIKYATDNTGEVALRTFSTKTKENLKSTTPIPLTWDRKDLSQVSSSNSQDSPTISEDFRAQLLKDASLGQQTFLSISPSYNPSAVNTGNIEKRTNFRGAGSRGNRKNYQEGKKDITSGRVVGPVDIINAVPIYQGVSPSKNEILKDMIDFHIGIYDNDTIGLGNTVQLNWMHFRVLLDDFSDSYGADWKAISYMGRAENFYKYDSFKRDISIGFTVAAQSKQELLPIYKKLNYLASSLAPSYSTNGFIRGNLSQITLGDWLREQPGFISSVDLSIPEDSPWEINVNPDGTVDPTVKQVPHMINVKIKFTPIHKFRPEINKLSNLQDVSNFSEDNILTQDPTYGPQRFIALEDKDANDGYKPSNQTTVEQENLSAVPTDTQQNQIPLGPLNQQDSAITPTYLQNT